MPRITTLILAMSLGLAACSYGVDEPGTQPEPQTPVADPVITIDDMEFENGTITVEEATTVTWVWEDTPIEHNVVFADFESPLQAEGTFTHTFEDAGTYEYHCAPHPFMTGVVTVVEAEGG